MTIDRRAFLLHTLGGTLGLGLAGCGAKKTPSAGDAAAASTPPTPHPATTPATPAPPAAQSILVLGGTGFLGPHIVDAALARGHKVTLFNRGKTRPGLFPDVEKLHGDRDGDLKSLEGRSWDAVVDTSGYVPRLVGASARLLAPSIKQYVFISTISVYAHHDRQNADETAPLATIADPTNEDTKANYGALKALSEKAAEAALPGRVTTIRPGLIVGPLDPTGRFTHWVTRLAEGGEALAPGDGKTLIQWIDARDLAAWIITTIEARTFGTFNGLGPTAAPTMREVLDTCNAAGGNKATLTWVDAAFLEKHKVGPWSDLPMWIPPEGDFAGFGTLSNARALAAGLTFRPLATTAADTLAWFNAQSAERRAKLRAGLPADREAAALAAWHART
jgi:2'-hydroxyisoflavone reductase